MKNTSISKSLALAGFLATAIATASANITIDVVNVGNAGNPSDSTGYGGVAYEYAIGKFEVTIGQYSTFLNAVAATDTNNLYSAALATELNIAGISRSGSSGSYTYSVVNNAGSSANRPVTYVSWFDAARFANWMANGQPAGAQGNSTTENGAYTLNGANGSGVGFTKNAINPNTGTAPTWWIPSENEWYKAAYYDPTQGAGGGDNYWLYATQSNSVSSSNVVGTVDGQNYFNGSYATTQSSTLNSNQNYLTTVGAYDAPSFYGTYDQGGNAGEWNDAVISNKRGVRGGDWGGSSISLRATSQNSSLPGNLSSQVGFRLATIPEPSTVALMLLSGFAFLRWKRWRS